MFTKRIICVRARKCSDTLLDSGRRYYKLSQPCCIDDKSWHFFVLLRENCAGLPTPIFRVLTVLNFWLRIWTILVLTFKKSKTQFFWVYAKIFQKVLRDISPKNNKGTQNFKLQVSSKVPCKFDRLQGKEFATNVSHYPSGCEAFISFGQHKCIYVNLWKPGGIVD